MTKYNYYRSLEHRETADTVNTLPWNTPDVTEPGPVNSNDTSEHTLPCNPDGENAPLAISSVPMQVFRDLLSDKDGLSAGTIFRELDLPLTAVGGKR